MKPIPCLLIVLLCAGMGSARAQQTEIEVSGVFPRLAMVPNHQPRSEGGTGALMPWAGRLWVMTYVAHTSRTGSGTGLYEINEEMKIRKRPESVTGTYANRLIHRPTQQLVIGPYVIDTLGNVRTIESLIMTRICATMEHLEQPQTMVYCLGMEGEFFEVDLTTLESRFLFDLMETLEEPEGSKPHFKDGWTHQGRVYVVNNSYDRKDFDEEWAAGRLAEYDGNAWTILERTAFTEVWGARAFGQPFLATGWDNKSAILKAKLDGEWKRYRLPKGSYTFDQTSCTEWMRIREVETERALMDCHGIFYEISYHTYGEGLWGIQPIARHLRVVPDFCSWRGMLVMGGNQATPMAFRTQDRNPLAGQPQAGLWFGKTDDLWSWGKPTGMGGVWYNDEIKKGEVSDPFLMLGFDKKVLHLEMKSNSPVSVTLEVDFVGDGSFRKYQTLMIPNDGYLVYEFPPAFSAHWIRLLTNRDCMGTGYFIYH